MSKPFLHELPDAKALFEIVAQEQGVLPLIVEKDYWLTHCLWGLQQQGFQFELKGGTSLSKGFQIIKRFSEDIDIQIHPPVDIQLKYGKNHDKPQHITDRRHFFDGIAKQLNIPGLQFYRDHLFDDNTKMRSAGIRGEYHSYFSAVPALKSGIVLELGFDQTTPNITCEISAWAINKINQTNITVQDNHALNVKCYAPEYTFVEKLQTISTKFRRQQQDQTMPINFLRHYYDVYQLLHCQRVIDFIGTKKYFAHKKRRFRQADEMVIANNEAFILSNKNTRIQYSHEFIKKSAIYFNEQPSFDGILAKIGQYIERL